MNKSESLPALMSSATAVRYLGVTIRTLRRWSESGRVEPVKIRNAKRQGGAQIMYFWRREDVMRIKAGR